MRNPSLFLLSIALSVQFASAVPVPIDELAPVSGALKSAASALQGTTKGLSTGMAGGLGGMAGAMTAIPKFQKRQLGGKSLGLSLAGVEPGDIMKVVQDPTSALENLPIPGGLAKRVLGGLGGLGGLLGGLSDLVPSEASPPPAPQAPPPSPPASQVKEKGTDSSVNVDSPPETTSEAGADIAGLEEALEGSTAARNSTDGTTTSNAEPETTNTEKKPESQLENSPESQTFSSPNTNTVANTQDGQKPGEGADTQVAANERLLRRVLDSLMPKSKLEAEGLKNPELILKKLGAADVIKTVIDAPDLTGMKEKRSPVDPLARLDSVSKALNSAATLLKAVPLTPA